MSRTVLRSQFEQIEIIEGPTKTVLSCCVAKILLYSFHSNEWKDTDLIGGITLIFDRELSISCVKLYDLNEFVETLQYELPNDVFDNIQILSDNFLAIPMPKDYYLGLLFSDSLDCHEFKQKIKTYSIATIKDRGVLDKVFLNQFSAKKHTNKPNVQIIRCREDIISKPKSYSCLNHIAWDSYNNCFDFSQISKEFKTILKNAGIKKKELKDPETASAIFGTLVSKSRSVNPVLRKKKTFSSNMVSIFSNKNKSNSKNKDESDQKDKNIPNKPTYQPDYSKTTENPQISSFNPELSKTTIESKKKDSLPDKNNEGKQIIVPPIVTIGGPPPPPPPIAILTQQINKPIPPPPINLPQNSNKKRESKKESIFKAPISTEKGNLMDEIRNRNFKLKSVEESKAQEPQQQFTKQEEITMTSVLAKAINERRQEMMKFNKDSSDDDNDSDWSND